MKALTMLKYLASGAELGMPSIDKINEAIEELEALYKEISGLNEYVKVATYYLEFYRCRCGALGRVGYLCSNENCTEE